MESVVKTNFYDSKNQYFIEAIDKVNTQFQKVILVLEHEPLYIESDPFFSATMGSDVFAVYDRITITDTFLRVKETIGDYTELYTVQKYVILSIIYIL